MCTQTHTNIHKHLKVYKTKMFIFRVDKLLKLIEGSKMHTYRYKRGAILSHGNLYLWGSEEPRKNLIATYPIPPTKTDFKNMFGDSIDLTHIQK